MNPWLIVPTLGNRMASLRPLLRDAGMPAVVIDTGDAGLSPSSDEHVVLKDDGPMNIQRWWNLGIDYAVKYGDCDVAVVVNDDVEAEPGEFRRLAERLSVTGMDLMYPWVPEHAHGRVTAITGWCFAIDPQCLRPDETFEWWYGDNDLELRTEVGCAMSFDGLRVRHLRKDWSYDRPVDAMIRRDRELFNIRWGWKVGMQ